MSKILTPEEKDQLDSLVRDALRDHEKVIGHYINLVDFLVERLVKEVTDWHFGTSNASLENVSDDADDEKFFQQTEDMIEFGDKANVDMSTGGFTIYSKEFKK